MSQSPSLSDQLLDDNRALRAQVAQLEQRLAEAQSDEYRNSWLAIVKALDQAKPNWRDAGTTATVAIVTTILSGLPLRNLCAFLAVRGPDVQPLLTMAAVRAYEKKGYSIIPLFAP
jgi:cell division septum initiation protein DivIVA